MRTGEQALLEPTEGRPPAPRPLSLPESFLHLIKGNIGPGVLALPLHFARTGPLLATGVTAVVVAQGMYGMRLLLHVQEIVVSRRTTVTDRSNHPCDATPGGDADDAAPSFEDVGAEVYGVAGRRAVQLTVLALQLGVCAAHLSLVATNVRAAADGALDHRTALLVSYGCCSCLALLPRLTHLWPLSLFGSAAMMVALGSALAAAILQIVHPDAAPPAPPAPPPAPAHPRAEMWACAAAAFYAFEGVALVLPIRSQLRGERARRLYPRVLISALLVVATTFLAVG